MKNLVGNISRDSIIGLIGILVIILIVDSSIFPFIGWAEVAMYMIMSTVASLVLRLTTERQ